MIFKNYVMWLIYDDIGRVLLIKKNRPKHQVGKWNGLGGKVEDNETITRAMTREELIERVIQSLCDSVDQETLLKLYYDDNYSWLESLSRKDLLEEAIRILGEKVELDPWL